MKYDTYLESLDCYVNKDGSIYSYHKGYKRMIKHHYHYDKDGYQRVTIHSKIYYVHRIIALAFIPNPNNLPVVDHINHVRNDNSIENLRWATIKQNAYNLSPTPLHDKINVRRIDDKKEYTKQYNALRHSKQLMMIKPNGVKTQTRFLSDEEYTLLKPLNHKDRYLYYDKNLRGKSALRSKQE